jgi:phospholipase C
MESDDLAGQKTWLRNRCVSPFAKKGFIDRTPYDTTSILRLITKRFGLPVLPGIRARDEAVKANGGAPLGDLTNALTLTSQ